MKIFADLHNHTTASDGDFTPGEMVKKARDLGLKVVGITDHDTLAGLKEAVRAGEDMGIEVVPGVEVSICFKRSYFTGTLHLLCYFLPEKLQDPAFVREFETLLSRGRGRELVRARIQKINESFGPGGRSPLLYRDMVYEDIACLSPNASRRHFALCLDREFGIKDRETGNTIIGNDSPAYLPSGIPLETVAGFIKRSGVFPVLAHGAAGSFPGKGHYKEVLPPVEIVEKILPEFLAAGLKGLEVNYPGHILEHRQLLKGWAKTHGLFITGGSDCHDPVLRPPGVEGISEPAFIRFKSNLK